MTIELDDAGARAPRQRAPVDEGTAMRSVELELRAEFPSVPVDQLTILVECLWAHFDDAPVRDFVPVLVRKQAKEELRDDLGRQAEVTAPGPDVPTMGATEHHLAAAPPAGRRRRFTPRHLMLRG